MWWIDWVVEVYRDGLKSGEPNKMAEMIFSGRPIMKNPVFQQPIAGILDKMRSRVCECKTHLDMIKVIGADFSDDKLRKYIICIDKDLKKNVMLASKLRNKSIKFVEASNYEMALRCINLAMLFCPHDSSVYSDLFADRAVLLNTLKDFKTAFDDAEYALIFSENISVEMRIKLLNIRDQGMEFRNHPEGDPETYKYLAYSKDVIFHIYGDRNPRIPSAGDYLSIVMHPVKGRIIITTQDLQPGTTVLVEKPFVSVLTASTQWELKHCSRCYEKTRAFVSCPDCVFAAYCSEGCRVSDQNSTHKYECHCLNYIHATGVPSSIQMGFRAICKAGSNYMYKTFKELTGDTGMVENDEDGIKGFDPQTGRYDSNSYFQIMNLIYHGKGDFPELLAHYSYNLAQLLDVKTNYFEKIEPKNKSAFVDFIASQILRHSISFPFNAMTIREDEPKNDDVKLSKLETDGSGTDNNRVDAEGYRLVGVYPLSSLLSHSCDPSATRIHMKNGKLAIITKRGLKAGEEVTISYGPKYFSDNLDARTAHLGFDFRINCECNACVHDWPALDKLTTHVQYICPKCTGKFSYEENIKLRKCVIEVESATFGVCRLCGAQLYLADLKREYNRKDRNLEMAKVLMTQNLVDAIPRIVSSIEYFQSRVVSPSLALINAQSLLENALYIIAAKSGE